MAEGKFPADEINDRALERLFATRLKTGKEKEIFEVSEHNLEEARSWLKFSIGRQTWTADTQGRSGCWRIARANRRERSRYSHAIILQRGRGSQTAQESRKQHWTEEQKEWRKASKEKMLHALFPSPSLFVYPNPFEVE